jgi:PadR family transcriptional regulator PadR
MAVRDFLGEFELMVLLAVIRTGDGAYGVPILKELCDTTRRDVSFGSVYAALDRLEQKGMVSSSLGDPTPVRGGRAKRYFSATNKGLRQARLSREALVSLWQGIPQLEGGRG